MKLIAGLGNVGSSYGLTRHNIGFMAADALADGPWKRHESSLIQKIKIENESVLLAKPQTYMNLSGQAVGELVRYYKMEKKDLLIIQDDVDLPFLSMKFQIKRGSGGHKGIQNIHDVLGSSDYYRLKMGVGKSDKKDTSDHVLSSFNKAEMKNLETFILKAAAACRLFVLKGGAEASNRCNQQTKT